MARAQHERQARLLRCMVGVLDADPAAARELVSEFPTARLTTLVRLVAKRGMVTPAVFDVLADAHAYAHLMDGFEDAYAA